MPSQPSPLQEPADFAGVLEDEAVPPVLVPLEGIRGKRKGKGDRKGRKKSAKSAGSNASPSAPTIQEEKNDVLESFPEAYQAVIKTLPTCLWPVSKKHGQHSYTVCLGGPYLHLFRFDGLIYTKWGFLDS